MKPEDTKLLVKSSKNSNTTYLGVRTDQGYESDIGIDDPQRLKHTLEIGATGTGKSAEMMHAALQDAEKGHGFTLINPKGDLIKELVAKLPEDRLDDIIYVNPAGKSIPGINVLKSDSADNLTEQQKNTQQGLVVSYLIGLFKRQSENWGDRFGRILETLLRATINQNLKHDEEYTLLDVFRCITEQEALQELIDKVEDPVVREQLKTVRDDYGKNELEPLQRRLNDFVMDSTIREIISAKQSSVNFKQAVEDEKIILVEIQKGEIGKQVSQLVGSLVITKIWASIQSRVSMPAEEREPYFLYVDELDNFASEGSGFDEILSEGREYRFGFWGAVQYIDQLPKPMRQAVTGNCRTKLVFDPAESEDLTKLSRMLRDVSKEELQSLGDYRAAVSKPSSNGSRKEMAFIKTLPPWPADRSRDKVKQVLREQSASSGRTSHTELEQSLGSSANAGGEKHRELLIQAKEQLQQRDLVGRVSLLDQPEGTERPDGRIIDTSGETVGFLEAEHGTLSRPVKILRNLERGLEAGVEVFYVVEEGNQAKLENIVSDPVNRRGDTHEDGQGSFDYYTDEDGDPLTDVERLADAEYRVLEIREDDLVEHTDGVDIECPELGEFSEEELEEYCIHREDGYCSALGQPCVLLEGESG
ncbi:type IV secretory system conjugative DNA transfer family protein [Halobium salinum]|uniref:Type IV secretory system conjugative DNA transfer family protein n=1 Tax=Halobium salinum TaxID=1364940 RepID=A0ABD5PET6_9EURY|nr:TraM recognition domain-containing protein [Halobium salinum]